MGTCTRTTLTSTRTNMSTMRITGMSIPMTTLSATAMRTPTL